MLSKSRIDLPVSILIQHEGWMLGILAQLHTILSGFNPHPTRRLDARLMSEKERLVDGEVSILIQHEGWMLVGQDAYAETWLSSVSILIQHEGWMLVAVVKGKRQIGDVSILIQHEGWMLADGICTYNMISLVVSILIQHEGWMLVRDRFSFQQLQNSVSILIQHEGWMLAREFIGDKPVVSFQSSSNTKVGC